MPLQRRASIVPFAPDVLAERRIALRGPACALRPNRLVRARLGASRSPGARRAAFLPELSPSIAGERRARRALGAASDQRGRRAPRLRRPRARSSTAGLYRKLLDVFVQVTQLRRPTVAIVLELLGALALVPGQTAEAGLDDTYSCLFALRRQREFDERRRLVGRFFVHYPRVPAIREIVRLVDLLDHPVRRAVLVPPQNDRAARPQIDLR